MNAKTLLAALGAALLLAPVAPLAAQQHAEHACSMGQHAGMRHGGAGHGAAMHAMAHGPAGMALMHRAELALSAEQASRLEALEASFAAGEARLREQAAAAEAAVRAEAADEARLRAALERRGAVATEKELAAFRARRDARAVLTAQQAAKLDAAHAAMHGASGHGGHGQAHGASGHAMHHGAAADSGGPTGAAGHGDCAACCRECCGSDECCKGMRASEHAATR